MPPVLQPDLYNYKNEQVEIILLLLKFYMLDAAFEDMNDSVLLHSIPEKSVL